MMGTATRSSFFKPGSNNLIKPIELLKSRSSGSKSLLQTLWFERAQRTLSHINHFQLLLDQFEFMCQMSYNLQHDSTPSLKKSFKEEKVDKVKQKKYGLVQEIKKFLELYQTYSIKDYDYWDYKNATMFSLFVEKFEKESTHMEMRASKLILGMIDESEEAQKMKPTKLAPINSSQGGQRH